MNYIYSLPCTFLSTIKLNVAFDPSALFLGFEMPSYTVQEDAGVLNNLIFVVKEPAGVQTEKDISVILNLVGSSSAEEGL